jgi:2-polyprenyl-3-methyl-5-hydroxy-6-metoxy-1,4-benzoquinol methylase
VDREAWRRLRRRRHEERSDAEWAPIYDEHWGGSIDPTHQRMIEAFLRLCRPDGRVLDAACGTGKYWPALLASGRSVFGIDQSAGMLRQARQKHPEVPVEKVGLQELDAADAFDGLCCVDALEMVAPEDWPVVLGNFCRALRPASPLYVTVELINPAELAEVNAAAKSAGLPVVEGEYAKDDSYHYYPRIEQVRAWLANAGFVVRQENVGDGYHHVIAWKEDAMPADSTPTTESALNEATRDVWDQNAAFWDEKMGDGNDFHRALVRPAAERLLGVQPGEVVLDVACGNGLFARRLAELGASVVACDFSARMIEQARQRPSAHPDRIEYRVVDATDEGQLLALGSRRFDAAICNMALMDMATIEPLLRALAQLLKPNGRFVFTVCHPCFNSTGARKVAEEEDRDGEIVTTYGVKVVGYLHLPPRKGLAIIGQPAAQYYFDRPLSVLLGTCFRAGFVLDGLEEPAFAEEASSQRWYVWNNLPDIPPVLAARLRLTGAPA